MSRISRVKEHRRIHYYTRHMHRLLGSGPARLDVSDIPMRESFIITPLGQAAEFGLFSSDSTRAYGVQSVNIFDSWIVRGCT